MAVTRHDYSAEAVAAARSVLLELAHLLGAYGDDIVVVGGWVPELLLPNSLPAHIGSNDVDLALNHRTLAEPRYLTFRQRLLEQAYVQSDKQPYIFYRHVPVRDREIVVQVDFLAGEYQGTSSRHRHQKFEEMRARKARGADLAFELNTPVRIEGNLPDGGLDQAVIRVASVVPFLVMKGIALAERISAKDAWDIYFILRNYPAGLDGLVGAFAPHANHGLVREGLQKIGAKFASPDHVGPKWVADFDEIADLEERARIQRDAYERVNYVLEKLKMRPTD